MRLVAKTLAPPLREWQIPIHLMRLRDSLILSFARRGGLSLAQFVSTVILARLLSPEEFGIFVIALALVALATAIRQMGVEKYLIKEKDLTPAKIETIFGFSLLLGCAIGALIMFSRFSVSHFYQEPLLESILLVMSLNFFLAPFGQPAMALMRRERRYGALAVIELIAALVGICVSITLAWFGHGPISMAWGSLASSVSVVALAFRARPKDFFLRPSLSEWRNIGSFSGIAAATAFITTLGMQIAPLVMGKALTFADVGLYNRSNRFPFLIRNLMQGSVNWVTGAEYGQRHREGESYANLVLKVTDYSLVLTWPIFVFLAVWAEDVVVLLFGLAWAGAAPILQLMSIAHAINAIYGQAQSVYESSGDITLKFRNEVILQSLSIVLLVASLPFGVVGVAASRIIMAFAATLVHVSVLRRYASIGIAELTRSTIPATVLSAALIFWALVIQWIIGDISDFRLTGLAASGLIYCSVTVVALALFRHGVYFQLKTALQEGLHWRRK